MNFRNVKIFFIVLLVAVNIFLLFSYMSSDIRSSHIDDETINNITQVLSSHGVTVNTQTIPRESYRADIIEASFDAGYYERVAQAVSMSEKESVNIMPDNSLRIIMKNGDSFTLDRRFGFEFVSESMTPMSISEFAAIFSAEENAFGLGFAKTSLTSDEKKLVNALLAPESMTNADSPFAYKLTAVYSNDSAKVVVCDQTVDGTNVHEHTMYIEITNGSISRAAGIWFFAESMERYSSNLYDQLSVLFAELDHKNSIPAENAVSEYSITDMGFTYCIYWNTRQDGLFLIPAWEIVTDRDETRIYNAVNCELYE
ncbi:MAG: hypothetical protein IJ391_05885 [Clostridia bacterium]|nr:hypothetical protein [Clostridia bacterium]